MSTENKVTPQNAPEFDSTMAQADFYTRHIYNIHMRAYVRSRLVEKLEQKPSESDLCCEQEVLHILADIDVEKTGLI